MSERQPNSVSTMCRTLHEEIEFVTDCNRHSQRTAVLRVVHPSHVHDVFLSNLKQLHKDEKTILFTMASTNAKEESVSKKTQTTYVVMWHKNSIRQETLFRRIVLCANGLDPQLRACRDDIQHLNSLIRDKNGDEEDVEKARKELNERKSTALMIREEISYALLPTTDFWTLIKSQFDENRTRGNSDLCDILKGRPCKTYFNKKRPNKSLIKAAKKCKKKKLEKMHRPCDEEEKREEERKKKKDLRELVEGDRVRVGGWHANVGKVVKVIPEDSWNSQRYRLQFSDGNTDLISIYSPDLIEVTYKPINLVVHDVTQHKRPDGTHFYTKDIRSEVNKTKYNTKDDPFKTADESSGSDDYEDDDDDDDDDADAAADDDAGGSV